MVIDHIHPVAAGGDNDPSNLTTACESCNQGKKDRLLSAIPIRPDADLLYLSTQQEAAELRRYRVACEELAEERRAVIGTLQALWCELSGANWCPNDAVLRRMLQSNDVAEVSEVIVIVAANYVRGRVRKYGIEPYMWGVLRKRREEMK